MQNLPGYPGYLVIDTETNALPDYKLAADAPGQPRLAAVALILTDPELEILSASQFLIRPVGWKMEPEATAVNGLTDEILLRDGIAVEDALRNYVALIDMGYPVIAFNSRFDCKIMRGELRLAGMDDRFEQTPNWCAMRGTASIVQAKNKRGGFKFPNLKEACTYFSLSPAGQHTAMGDASACLELARSARNLGIEIRPEVHYAKNRPEPD